jgi:hypothetical protein
VDLNQQEGKDKRQLEEGVGQRIQCVVVPEYLLSREDH